MDMFHTMVLGPHGKGFGFSSVSHVKWRPNMYGQFRLIFGHKRHSSRKVLFVSTVWWSLNPTQKLGQWNPHGVPYMDQGPMCSKPTWGVRY